MTIYETIYSNKESSYFTSARMDLIELLPRCKTNKILELGAGTGETLLAAKSLGLASEVVGIDLVKIENSNQSNPDINKFIIGNIESLDLELEENYFDVIICADVLEHLVEPLLVIKKISKHLKMGGIFISSIPNIRHYTVMRSILVYGDFDYEDGGILDKTHLRFFCRKNVIKIFQENGYDVIKIKTNMGGYGLKHKLLNNITFGVFKDLFVFQFCTVARKK